MAIIQKNSARLEFDSVALLQAESKPSFVDGQIVYIKGITASNDDGHGNFRYDSSSSATDDGATIINPIGIGNGRFLRVFGDVISVKDFGAVGDGSTNDNAALLLWIAEIQSSLKVGVIPAGTFIFTDLDITAPCRIEGMGGTLKLKSNTTDQSASTAYYPIKVASDNVSISNVNFNGNGTNNRPVTPISPWVADIITLIGDNIQFSNNYLYDAPDSGVMFAQCQNSNISHNRIDDIPDAGIYCNDSTGSLTANNNIVSSNNISRCKFAGIGIKRHLENILVSGNTIYDCGNGITCEDFGSGNDPDRFVVSNNIIRYIGYSYMSDALVAGQGLSVQECENATYIGNSIYDCMDLGINVSGAQRSTFIGNTYTGVPKVLFGAHDGSANAAILTDTSQAWPVNYFIGDTITNTTDGSTATITANTATTITGTLSGAPTGSITAFADAGGGEVTVTSAGHSVVNGNVVTITGTTSYNGTFVASAVTTNTFDITDTWVANDATGTFAGDNDWDVGDAFTINTAAYGIQVGPRNSHGTTDCSFIGNRVYQAEMDAIRIIGGTGDNTGNRFLGNFLNSAGASGIQLSSTSKNNEFSDNTFDSDLGFDINQNVTSGTVVANMWGNNRAVNGTINGLLDASTGCWNHQYGNGNKVTASTGRPTAGTWKAGDISYENAEATGDPFMYRCQLAGTPGTWTTAAFTQTGARHFPDASASANPFTSGGFTPHYTGELVYNSTTKTCWMATGETATALNWQKLN